MFLKNNFKRNAIAISSALLLSLGALPSVSKATYPLEEQHYSETKKQQEPLNYKLKFYLLGIRLVNETMRLENLITEDSEKTEHKLSLVPLKTSDRPLARIGMRKITYNDAQNLEELCEEYSYELNYGSKEAKKAHIKIYPDTAEIYKDNELMVKNEKCVGLLSFIQAVARDDLKIGEANAMDVLFGKNIYRFEYNVTGEETLYERYVLVREGHGADRYEGRGKSYKTCKVELKTRRAGSDNIRKDTCFWIGREGKCKGDIIKIKFEHNWALVGEMMLLGN